jgi:hypothetical protein
MALRARVAAVFSLTGRSMEGRIALVIGDQILPGEVEAGVEVQG